MGIEHPGSQAEPFDERVLSQIKSLREKYEELIISVDGSVNDKTAHLLRDAGASRLVVGSFLFDDFELEEKINYLENL